MTEMQDKESGQAPHKSALPWLWLSLLAIVVDLGTKALATAELTYGVSEPVLPFFNLTLLHNTGAAFSFLSDASGWQRWFFAGLAIVVSIVLVRWLATLDRRRWWLPLSISLILGGALGNLYDRIVHGYVVDFLHFYWQQYHFPAFNLADSFITVGAVMMAIEMFRNPGPQKEDSPHE
ncbi:signal peptidase II [Marinobacteraceae bacterium S3BR75-40.1]